MATRTRRAWKLDRQGHYARQIGWKSGSNGHLVQHKFQLGGRDLKEAQRREVRLRELWEAIEAIQGEGDAQWTDETLAYAKQIASGALLIELPQRAGESPAE